MPRFTDEEYLEILKGREEMRAYKEKVVKYPAYPEDLPPRPDPLPPVLPEHRLIKKLLEVEGIANYAKQKVQEHTLSSKKRKYTIRGGEGSLGGEGDII